MNTETLFSVASSAAVGGWIVLVLAPLAPRLTGWISGLAIPILLSLAYAALILAFWSAAVGGFSTLPEVMLLFTKPEIALAGWIHYLAFDLFVGAWETRVARQEAIPHLLLLPCLLLTFMFGPIGFLAFVGLRLARSAAYPAARGFAA